MKNRVTVEVTDKLCSDKYFRNFLNKPFVNVPLPSIEELRKGVEILKKILFPGFFAHSEMNEEIMHYYIGANLDKVHRILREQIKRGYCFACDSSECERCELKTDRNTEEFIKKIPELRLMLYSDVDSAFKGDPAASSRGETIFCYPSISSLIYYRIAHELVKLGVPLIPRIFTEMAHSETGIDIHPGAQIGKSFFMDHGTGIVIGETCVIGENVKLYQGVTLGAKSFPVDENNNPVKGIKRHPVVENDVTIYAGATILGPVTIGRGSVIGGNVWITRDIPPYTRVIQNHIKSDDIIIKGIKS